MCSSQLNSISENEGDIQVSLKDLQNKDRVKKKNLFPEERNDGDIYFVQHAHRAR